MSEHLDGHLWQLLGMIIGGLIVLGCQHLYYKYKDK